MTFCLDVVIPIYSKTNENDLLKALNSVTSLQTYKPDNVLIVCDGEGCEATIEYLQHNYLDTVNVVILSYKENRGPGFARDYAIQHSSADLIALMDSDDLSVKNRFELQVNEFQSNTNLSLCGAYIKEMDFDSLEECFSIRTVPLEHHDITKVIKIKSPFNNVTVMFKRDTYNLTGGFPDKRTSEDYALWGRFISLGIISKNLAIPLVVVNFNHNALNRRSGITYFRDDFTTQKELLARGILDKTSFVRNIFIYFVFRFLPRKVITFLYQRVLRK